MLTYYYFVELFFLSSPVRRDHEIRNDLRKSSSSSCFSSSHLDGLFPDLPEGCTLPAPRCPASAWACPSQAEATEAAFCRSLADRHHPLLLCAWLPLAITGCTRCSISLGPFHFIHGALFPRRLLPCFRGRYCRWERGRRTSSVKSPREVPGRVGKEAACQGVAYFHRLLFYCIFFLGLM